MVHDLKFEAFIIILTISSIPLSNTESSKCVMVYKQGGAPAVFQSPKCPRWTLSAEEKKRTSQNYYCQSYMVTGRRKIQEDRTLCALDLRIPFPGNEIIVGMVAVFDGHNGADASHMASNILLDYFFLHVYFLLDGIYSVALEGQSNSISQLLLNWVDQSFYMEILKESLLRAIHDIDATFSEEAFRRNLNSGSTATIVLIVDNQVLVSNVGDSKAILCSERFRSPKEVKDSLRKLYRERRRHGVISSLKEYDSCKSRTSSDGLKHYFVKELTRDHHPDRDDERSRVEAAGGYVEEWGGVPRVNGELAVSRAIGDVPFKSYGVISAPEVTGWQHLTANDSYLIAASDGIFEKMTTQDVCDILWEVDTQGNGQSECFSSCMYSLAECIVNTAFEKGSMDNMAAVVVPLKSIEFSGSMLKERCEEEGNIGSSASGLQKFSYIKSANAISSSLVPVASSASQITASFNRLLVERTQGRHSLFYLYQDLNENMDYKFVDQKDDGDTGTYDLPQALPGALWHSIGGPINFYRNQNLCMHFGMDTEGYKGQCINPESFDRFLGLLDSIPFPDTVSNSSGSSEYDTPNSRYVLKRRFGRGSYGEVWLAFHWNHSQDGNLGWNHAVENCSNSHLDSHDHNTSKETNSSVRRCVSGPDSDNFFILKRIMVERGNAVYLSGLREKYFGEVFLNASTYVGGLLGEKISSSFSEDVNFGNYYLLGMDEAVHNEKGYVNTPENEEGLEHIARYVESFESRSKEIWLVFRNEGSSLTKLIYTVESVDTDVDEEKSEVRSVQVLRPSTWWHWLRTTEAGQEAMRNLIWQLLMAIKSCHNRNITHRDIKPENMVLCIEDESTGRCSKGSPIGDKQYHIKMHIIDFGSAIDEFTIKHLYGSNGPSRSEQTYDYTPPEALLNTKWFEGPRSIVLKYDMWSVGVVMLELILGSPDVFQLSARTRTLLDQHLDGWNEDVKDLAYKLRSLMEMCILIPGISSKRLQRGVTGGHGGISPASWKCSEEFFSDQIRSRDPLKQGFPTIWALRLVRQLLVWDPEDRLSVDDALQHPYFQPPPQV